MAGCLTLIDPGFDSSQGALGDCWFLSAISCVAMKPELLDKVFLKADPDKGYYVVRFFKDGAWRQVRVMMIKMVIAVLMIMLMVSVLE
jgi:hypothetical protein